MSLSQATQRLAQRETGPYCGRWGYGPTEYHIDRTVPLFDSQSSDTLSKLDIDLLFSRVLNEMFHILVKG
jgi:hypothetical protein